MSRADVILAPGLMHTVRREAFAAARALHRFGFEPADVQQEFFLHVLGRTCRFDESRASFATFAVHLCRSRKLSLIESGSALKRNAAVAPLSLSEPVGECDARELEETLSQDEYMMRTGRRSRPAAELVLLRIDVGRVVDALPAEIIETAQFLVAGERPADIARHLGISRATLYRRIATLRAAFRAAGFGNHIVGQEAA